MHEQMASVLASSFLLLPLLPSLCLSLPRTRVAPEACPLQNGNLIDTLLFVANASACEAACAATANCLYFHYFDGRTAAAASARSSSRSLVASVTDRESASKPAQCYLYDECRRKVIAAADACPINKENTVSVKAFVRSDSECSRSCSEDPDCGYYRHYPANDTRQPLMCYHLRNCSPRLIRRSDCPLEVNNYIEHELFVQSDDDCKQRCEDRLGCRFYYWHPIDYSPAPLFCYLFRSCESGADEPTVAVILAGRHPGHYFLDQQHQSLEVVNAADVCQKDIHADSDSAGSASSGSSSESPLAAQQPGNELGMGANLTQEDSDLFSGRDISVPDVSVVARAGAVAEWDSQSGRLVLCGGRDHTGAVRADCVTYEPAIGDWQVRSVSSMRSAREDAASAVLPSRAMVVLGGLVNGSRVATAEQLSHDGTWASALDLPEARARFCAVAVNASTLAVLGGETDDASASTDFKMLFVAGEEGGGASGGSWTTQPEMAVARKDHACVVAKINGERGLLVTGGVGETGRALADVEFYSFANETWTQLAPLKVARTEHGLALVNGLPTVMGGVAASEFLRSIEVLDVATAAGTDAAPALGLEWRVSALAMHRPRYDFPAVSVPVSAMPDRDDCSAGKRQAADFFLEGTNDIKAEQRAFL